MSNYLYEHQDIIRPAVDYVELIASPLKHIHIPVFRGVILSKLKKNTDFLISLASDIYRMEKAEYKTHLQGFQFKSGATISFGVIHDEMDVLRYGGFAINYLGLYGANDFTDFQLIYLLSRSSSYCMKPYALAYESSSESPFESQ